MINQSDHKTSYEVKEKGSSTANRIQKHKKSNKNDTHEVQFLQVNTVTDLNEDPPEKRKT